MRKKTDFTTKSKDVLIYFAIALFASILHAYIITKLN